jgi:hypothetical protein
VFSAFSANNRYCRTKPKLNSSRARRGDRKVSSFGESHIMVDFKLIFFYGPLDALRYFMDRLTECAEERGIEYVIADHNDPGSYALSRLNSFL